MSASSVPAMPSFEALLDIFATMPYAWHSVSHVTYILYEVATRLCRLRRLCLTTFSGILAPE